MIVVYDLIKLKQTRRDNCRRVLVYGTATSRCRWFRGCRTRLTTVSLVS